MRRLSSSPLSLALLLTLISGCTGIVGEGENIWDDDSEERAVMFKHPPPPGSAPWTYYLTCYGGPSDSCYQGTPACGGKGVDGKWWYATGAWSFSCFSKLELRANGKCAVVNVVDNGPAGWVESKTKAKCGGYGYIIDASPLVTKHLYGLSCAGWSDCLKIEVRPVASNTPTGPCSSGSSAPPTDGGSCHDGQAFGWGYCSPDCPCGAGEGDCDSDIDCEQGLSCAHNVGSKYGAGSTVDVCEAAAKADDGGAGCHSGAPFGWNYCSPTCRCGEGEGEGDCDSDDDCQQGLTCVRDVGDKYGAGSMVDVCGKSAASAPPPATPPPATPPPTSDSCAYNGGSNYRKCRDCGWQFCLADGHWSSDCERKPAAFPCPAGQSCGSDARCY